jgi:hypothetical protein
MWIGLNDAPGRADHETGVRKYQEPSTSGGNPNLRPWRRARGARVRPVGRPSKSTSLSDVGTLSFRRILPFWYFCFLLQYKARLFCAAHRYSTRFLKESLDNILFPWETSQGLYFDEISHRKNHIGKNNWRQFSYIHNFNIYSVVSSLSITGLIFLKFLEQTYIWSGARAGGWSKINIWSSQLPISSTAAFIKINLSNR